MLHLIAAPNIGQPVVHDLGERVVAWGQAITRSIAHLVELHREIAIDYSRQRAGFAYEVVSGVGILPYAVDGSTFRLHVDASPFRQAANKLDSAGDSILRCDVGEEYSLKLWGRICPESPRLCLDHFAQDGEGATLPAFFKVAFWEISQAADERIQGMVAKCAEKDRKIHELELKVALAMCSQ